MTMEVTSKRRKLSPSCWGTRTVDTYEKLEQIGEGTYGQVYRSRNRTTNQIVALKKIRVHHEKNGLPVAALREIKVLKSLKHPHMVDLHEIVASKGREDDDPQVDKEGNPRIGRGNIYLVMEYVEHDISGLLDMQYRFVPAAIKTIMKQLLEVLQFLHENKYIHRDIKCSNLLLTRYHELKLADFGLTRRFSEETDNLTNKVITLWYRPPELLLGATSYGPAVDLWSVGCILAELLLGRPLFPAKTVPDQIALIFKTVGGPSEHNWSDFSSLPLASTLVPRMPLPKKLREMYGSRMPPDALDLVDRLLTLDPNRRISAQTALSSKYFLADPLPVEPRSLPKINRPPCHEFRTKSLLKGQRQAENASNRSGEQAKVA